MWHEFATDPKVQSMPEEMQRRLVMCYCLRCSNVLEQLQEHEIAFALRITDEDLAKTKALFVAKNFIDNDWKLLNWDRRQFISDVSSERVKRHRVHDETALKRRNTVSETFLERRNGVSETALKVFETPSESESDSESEKLPPKAPPQGGVTVKPSPWKRNKPEVRPETKAWFVLFWDESWKRGGKQEALEAADARILTEENREQAMAKMLHDKPEQLSHDPRHRKHVSSWINGGRWSDPIEAEPAPVSLASGNGNARAGPSKLEQRNRDAIAQFERITRQRKDLEERQHENPKNPDKRQ